MTPCDREHCFMCKLENQTDSEEAFRPQRTYKSQPSTVITFLNVAIIVVFVFFLISVYAKK